MIGQERQIENYVFITINDKQNYANEGNDMPRARETKERERQRNRLRAGIESIFK